jgi:hypothetical protein
MQAILITMGDCASGRKYRLRLWKATPPRSAILSQTRRLIVLARLDSASTRLLPLAVMGGRWLGTVAT